MLPILPEISLRSTPVTPDTERANPSVAGGFSNILQGFDGSDLPALECGQPAVSLQATFDISSPANGPFHFSRPLDLQVSGSVLPPTDAAVPDDGNVLPLAGPPPMTQAVVSANHADQTADPDTHPSEEDENPLGQGREDVEVRATILALGEQVPIAAKAFDPAHAVPAMAARVAPLKLPSGLRMVGPEPVREAMLVPVGQEREPQRVNPVQANSEWPITSLGSVLQTVSPGSNEAVEAGLSSSASSALVASISPSANQSTTAIPAGFAEPAAALALNHSPAAPSAAPPVQGSMAEPRAIAALETAIEHLAEAREAGRAARSQVTLSHQEFGAISLRIDASGNDLRATLASRDPGFVPAIQAALAERGINASSEAASTQSQRGSDQSPGHQGNQGQSQQGNTNSGGMADLRYAFSSGSGNASNLPYRDQNGASKEEQSDPAGLRAGDDPESESAQGGLFA